MKFFIGIVPSAEIYTNVGHIQKGFGDNRLEPHITVRPPVTVSQETDWINAIEQVCSTFPPFTIHLPATGNFGKRVLFIEARSQKLHELYHALVKVIRAFEQPEEKKQENQDYHPHLTLGRSWCGFTLEDFAKMRVLAEDFLSQKEQSFMVESLRIYHKPNGRGRYTPMKDIVFAAAAMSK
jgi:2'-5' RNA ligase